MRILICPDSPTWAINTLAQAKIKYNPHINWKCHYVHPRDAGEKQIQDEFKKIVDEFDPDIIHFEFYRSCSQLLEALPELKSRNLILTHHNQRTKALNSYDWFGNGIDYLITHTENCKKYLVEQCGQPEKMIKVINHGIDLNEFYYEGIEPKEKKVGYVGRIVPWKGLKEVARACKELGYKLQVMGKQDKPVYWNEIVSEGLDKVIDYSFFDCKNEERRDAYKNITIYVGNSKDGYEEGCYDKKTEVLTKDGWKYFKNLKYIDEIATLNPKTNQLEYQSPDKIVEYKDKKELIKIQNSTIDLCVTKNHNMWVSTATVDKNRKSIFKPYRMVKAKDLPSNFKIQRNCNWTGIKSQFSDDMIALFGLYVAEGSIKNKYCINLSVTKKEIREKTEKLLKKIGYKININNKNGYTVNVGKDIIKYLKKLKTAPYKYIPIEIKNSTKTQINIFLEWFCYGDGTQRDGWRMFYTSSKKLANDLQECLIKIGNNGDIKIRDRRGEKRWIVDHWCNCNELEYIINERVKKTESYIRKRYDMSIEKNNNTVYCAEVQNHIMLVRRNGKVCFCGNTMPYLEAIACGVPVVTTPNGVANDIGKDRVNCLMTPFEDYESLKDNIQELMEDKELRQKLRKNAWETVKNMSEEKMAYQYGNLYNKIKYKQDLVSIIIPTTFDRLDQLYISLDKLKEQNYKSFEVIVIFDEPKGNINKWITEYEKLKLKYPELSIKSDITYNDGYGLAMARNIGAIESTGKYLLFLDSRLMLEKDAIYEFVEQMEINNEKLKKEWLFGNKGGNKKTFVENFSFIKRKDFFIFGMMNERINAYGGMSQEIRIRWIKQGGSFRYIEDANAIELIRASKSKDRQQDIINTKYKLYKMYEDSNY